MSFSPAVVVLLAFLNLEYTPSYSLSVSPIRKGWMKSGKGRFSAKATGDDEDVLEYFDPLLSPHAYPNGISPANKLGEEKNTDAIDESERYDPFSLKRSLSTDQTEKERVVASSSDDVFDPTLSPHAYPNGTPGTVGNAKENTEVEVYDPLQLKKFEPIEDKRVEPTSSNVFDPLLSPHAYPDGTPDVVGDAMEMSQSVPRVGILLMDHGSRNKASNDWLHQLAIQYQETVGTHVIVKAAHMEIASPSIPVGLEELLSAGVDEIVCHPYFLSPYGRHAAEDIPQIISEAIESLSIDIPIITTDPVGAHKEIMISAMQTVIEKSSTRM